MLHHISLPVINLEKSSKLYDESLSALGFKRVCFADSFVGYGIEEGKDQFAIKQTDIPASTGPRFHLAFAAPTRKAVDDFYKLALSNGAKDDGRPGIRGHYGPDYYAAFIIDLDGHRIEAVINESDTD
jgi:catechol 2,3-dioxygenase-like lactoylglutathione lyase family enzyme